MTETLRLCNWCRGNDLAYEGIGACFHITCLNCGATGPEVKSADDEDATYEKAIAAWNTRSSWIKTEDQAPPKDKLILLFGELTHTKGFNVNGPVVTSGYWDEIDQAFCTTASNFTGPFVIVTHWQHLPNPPQESET